MTGANIPSLALHRCLRFSWNVVLRIPDKHSSKSSSMIVSVSLKGCYIVLMNRSQSEPEKIRSSVQMGE